MSRTLAEAGAVWFCVSLLVQIGSNVYFYSWLRKQHVPVRWAWLGIPGYLERAWIAWCRERGRSPQPWLALRFAGWINAALASIVFVAVGTPTLDATEPDRQHARRFLHRS